MTITVPATKVSLVAPSIKATMPRVKAHLAKVTSQKFSIENVCLTGKLTAGSEIRRT